MKWFKKLLQENSVSHCKLMADVSPLNCALNDSMCSEEIRFTITNTSDSEIMVAQTRCDRSKTTTTATQIADIDTAPTNTIISSASVCCCCGNIACNCHFVLNDSDSYSTTLGTSSSTKKKITGLLRKRFSFGNFSVSPSQRKSVSAYGRYEDSASDEPKKARSTAKISVNAEKRSATTTSSVRRRLFRNSAMENWPDITSELSAEARNLKGFRNGDISASPIVSWTQPRVFIDADEFFEDPCAVRLHREEVAWTAEWCIIDDIDLFVERQRYRASKPVYQETEFCGDSKDDDTFVKVNRTPSVISLTSYVEDEYGIFYSPVSYDRVIPKIPEACYAVGFDHDIECGLAFDNQIYLVSAYEEIMEETLQGASVPSTPIVCRKKLNTSAELLEEKVDALGKSLMGPLMTAVPKPIRKNTEFSVQKLFGLSDDGDICINIDHIPEERGYGFMLKKSRRVYRSVEEGAEINESHLIKRPALLLLLLRRLLQSLCCFSTAYETSDKDNNNNSGHPRNKTAPGNLPGESIGAYALTLAGDSASTFSRNIENFISCTKDSRELAPQVVMRNMRQFMSGMKNYLVKHGEGDFQNEVLRARSRLKADEFLNLDQILESVMHQLVVLPLKEHLYGLFVDYYTRTADIQLLVENVKYASSRSPADFGIRSTVSPPCAATMHQISLLLLRLQEAELPLDKLEYLLAVVSAIFETTTHPRGQALGADDFLPLLVYIVAKCGFIGAEIEAEFMWCLLQQSLLNGEAGYYLTALCSAVHVLKSFMASDYDGTGSLDIRSSSLPACSSVLRVIIPDEYNGSLQTRTLPVRPHTTTREVCRTIAHKARITNPQDYGLFKLVDGEETLLTDSDCPQETRLAARGKHCMLAYKRIDAKIAWPTLTTN